jgi:hypothetical protein
MSRRTWEATAPALRIREGRTGTPGAAMGPEPPLRPSLAAPWREPWMAQETRQLTPRRPPAGWGLELTTVRVEGVGWRPSGRSASNCVTRMS